ncbi:LOW QUALITY PROTEIN: hypothetical protein M9H77_23107 [Catharanthus roseus]|uniref:Uncharacterized protein n=1 Tax=Catharanthus roseus TaxID=4058 RepID=A0ACC0ATB1_CATRO|nr:LOW QUALITY PROTEIN: hypothetical protein M9H77_23107 [Catharanthus roseus]
MVENMGMFNARGAKGSASRPQFTMPQFRSPNIHLLLKGLLEGNLRLPLMPQVMRWSIRPLPR